MKELLNAIKQGQSCYLYGKRKTGKTTLALKIKEQLSNEFDIAYIDCGLIIKEIDLWKMVLKKLSLDYSEDFIELDFNFTEALEKSKNKKLIIFDEFELLINNPNISVTAFNYLRGLANPEINLTYLTITEKKISSLFNENIKFVGSPFWNIFTEYKIDNKEEE